MNKGFTPYTFMLLVVVVFAGYAIYYLVTENGSSTIGRSELSQHQATELVKQQWTNGSDSNIISVEVIDRNGTTYVYATYSLQDTSVSQSRAEGIASKSADGRWTLTKIDTKFACATGEGHLGFRSEPCI